MNSGDPTRGNGDVRPAKARDADELLGQYGAGALRYQGEIVGGADGVRFLERVIADIAAAVTQDMGKAAVMAPLIALYRDQARMDAVTAAAQHRAMEVEAVLLTLEAVPGMATTAKDLGRKLKAQVKARDAEARRASLRVAVDGETPVVALLLDNDELNHHSVPEGYELDARGVWKQYIKDGQQFRKRLADTPMVVTRRHVNIDDGKELVGLSWPKHDPSGRAWTTIMATRGSVADARKLLLYSDDGMPVHSGNAKGLVQYVADYVAENRDVLPVGWSTRRMGWLGSKRKVFVLGEDIVQPGDKYDVHLETEDGQRDIAHAIRCSGSEEAWSATMASIAPHPIALFGVYVGLAAPLIGILGVRSTGVDWSGTTSTAKTTTLKVVASCFGAPVEGALLHPWETTATGLEGLVSLLCDLPIVLDDSARIKPDDRAGVSSMLMMLANGSGKVRSNVNLGTRKQASWRTVVASSSEVPITSWSNDEGVRTRFLCIQTAPIPPGNKDLVDAVEASLAVNYGWAGRRMVQFLVKNPAQHEKLRAAYRDISAELQAQARSDQHARLAGSLAVFALAQQVAQASLGYEWATDAPIKAAWAALDATEIDKSRAAIDLAYGWAVENQRGFFGQHDPKQPPQRFHGHWVGDTEGTTTTCEYIAFIPQVLDKVLEDHGYQPAAILRDWRTRGWLALDAKGQNERPRINHKQTRCVCIKRDVLSGDVKAADK